MTDIARLRELATRAHTYATCHPAAVYTDAQELYRDLAFSITTLLTELSTLRAERDAMRDLLQFIVGDHAPTIAAAYQHLSEIRNRARALLTPASPGEYKMEDRDLQRENGTGSRRTPSKRPSAKLAAAPKDTARMQKHFVTFYSPGTFVSETTERAIAAWDVKAAMKMANEIIERYGATPYSFRFTTRSRGPNDLDSKQSAQSPFYFLGGKVESVADVERRADPKESILLSNMKGNGWNRIITNDNSWRWTQPLEDDDVVLDYKPPKRAVTRKAAR